MASRKQGATANEPRAPSIFETRERSGIFSRIVFYSYASFMRRLLSGDDRTALWRSLLLVPCALLVIAGLIAATPADFFLVWEDGGYERPSFLYALDAEGEYKPVAEYYTHNRRIIELTEESGPDKPGMDSRIVRSFIATEDNNFPTHQGLDIQGILRAALVNLLAGEVREGASTITQQVARLRFPLRRERSFVRKAREAFLAILLEVRYSKTRIMETYLNEVPLGHGAYGVDAAARFYFNKSVNDVGWGEAALIASLTTRPTYFSPLKNIRNSREKVQVVFKRLVETGQMPVAEAEQEYKTLEREYYANLNRSPGDNSRNQRLNLHPYVTEFVREYLRRNERGLYRKLQTGGLRIYTTIEHKHQAAAEKEMTPWLDRLTRQRRLPPFRFFDVFDQRYGPVYKLVSEIWDLPGYRIRMRREERKFHREFIATLRDSALLVNLLGGEANGAIALQRHYVEQRGLVEENLPVEGSLISMRPHTGRITAMVGGSGFKSSNQLLRFRSRRQPGSAFKPIVYAAGIDYSAKNPSSERKLTAASVIDDAPLQFADGYSPENYSDDFDGPIRLREGLTRSRNAVAVGVYAMMNASRLNPGSEQILGLDKLGRNLPKEATVALGSYEVSPWGMAAAYGVFASGGKEILPHVVLYITDSDGNMLKDFRPEYADEKRRQIIRPGTAQVITSMLQDVVTKGTGRGAKLPGRTAAGKTGTTNRGTNAWFVGFTPNLVTAVHIGYDQVKSLGRRATGGGLAAPLWGRYMHRALRGEKSGRFAYPGANVVSAQVCEISGKRPGAHCHSRVSELFLSGTVPSVVCNDHLGATSTGSDLPPAPVIRKPTDVFSGDDF